MKPMRLFDAKRMWLGEDLPWTFLLEIAGRALAVYRLLLLAVRLMGKRIASNLSQLELCGIVALAGAVGIPLQDPERGFLPALTGVVLLVVLYRAIGLATFYTRRAEHWAEGQCAVVFKDGVIQLATLRKSGYSRERFFSLLRNRAIEHLGQVERVYIEALVAPSIFLRREPIVRPCATEDLALV